MFNYLQQQAILKSFERIYTCIYLFILVLYQVIVMTSPKASRELYLSNSVEITGLGNL